MLLRSGLRIFSRILKMKRAATASKSQVEQNFNKLAKEYSDEGQNLSLSLTQHVAAIFDRVICAEKRLDPTVSFFYPPELVFSRLAKITPTKIQQKSEWSSKEGKHITFLHIYWELTSLEIADSLFGSTILSIRNYPDSNGEVNYAEKKGGELRPLVSPQFPLRLTYSTRTWELSVSFRFDRVKGFIEDGKTIFKSVV